MTVLRRGAEGQQVRDMQRALQGYLTAHNLQFRGDVGAPGVRVDGDFGAETLAALRAVQRHMRDSNPAVRVDGAFGPITSGVLSGSRPSGVQTRGRQRNAQPVGRMMAVDRIVANIGARVAHPAGLRRALDHVADHLRNNPGYRGPMTMLYTDYGVAQSRPRTYRIDLTRGTIVGSPVQSAHGQGSGRRGAIPTAFSNRAGSRATSLGLYVVQGDPRAFSGRASGRDYSSVAIDLTGVTPGYNDTTRPQGQRGPGQRDIVVHGAPYSATGRSHGCVTVPMEAAQRMLDNVGFVFVDAPQSRSWVRYNRNRFG